MIIILKISIIFSEKEKNEKSSQVFLSDFLHVKVINGRNQWVCYL